MLSQTLIEFKIFTGCRLLQRQQHNYCLLLFCSHNYQCIGVIDNKQHHRIYAVLDTILKVIIMPMKNPDWKTVSRLEEIPNLGKAPSRNLRLVGIQKPRDLIIRYRLTVPK